MAPFRVGIRRNIYDWRFDASRDAAAGSSSVVG